MKLIVGLDPGTGVSSPTGLAIFDADTKEVLHVETIGSNKKTAAGRIREIAGAVGEVLTGIDPTIETHVFIESFVLRGKGGETLARLTGAFFTAIPEHIEPQLVPNTTVKRLVGGTGSADKRGVAAGVAKLLGDNRLTDLPFDITDALAIGISGWLKLENPKA
jgi:Holliday junction resolvasome RuvABC endonuclease subunit